MQRDINLLTKKPECHRELFIREELADERFKKTPKLVFTLANLLEYYALSFCTVENINNYTTREILNKQKQITLGSVPEFEKEDVAKLVELVKKYGLEIILYAIDFVPEEGYPTVAQIAENIPDAEVLLAGLIRNRDYHVQ